MANMYQILRLCPIVVLGLFIAVPQGTSAVNSLVQAVGGIGRLSGELLPTFFDDNGEYLKNGNFLPVLANLQKGVELITANVADLVNHLLACISKFLQDVLQGFPKGVNAAIEDLLNCVNDAIKYFFAPPSWPKHFAMTTPSGASITGSKTAKKGGKKLPTPPANIFPTRPPFNMLPQDSPPSIKTPPRGPPRPVNHPPKVPQPPWSGAASRANANSNFDSLPNANSRPDFSSFPNAGAHSGSRSRSNFDSFPNSDVYSESSSRSNFDSFPNSDANSESSSRSNFVSFPNSDVYSESSSRSNSNSFPNFEDYSDSSSRSRSNSFQNSGSNSFAKSDAFAKADSW